MGTTLMFKTSDSDTYLVRHGDNLRWPKMFQKSDPRRFIQQEEKKEWKSKLNLGGKIVEKILDGKDAHRRTTFWVWSAVAVHLLIYSFINSWRASSDLN